MQILCISRLIPQRGRTSGDQRGAGLYGIGHGPEASFYMDVQPLDKISGMGLRSYPNKAVTPNIDLMVPSLLS